MTCLVTGGTGFIGAYIVRNLVRENNDVVVYDWFPEIDALERLLSKKELESKVKIVQGDVTDLAHLLRTVKENNVEKIIHTATLLHIPSDENAPLAIRVNCEGTVNTFEAARILGVKKVVWSSTQSVFGSQDMYPEEYVPNDAPHYPQGVYGATKSLGERLSEFYFDHYDVDITALRYTAVYGVGRRRGGAGLIRELIYNPALGKPGRVPNGDGTVCFTYVEDIARATVLASKVPRTKTRAFSMMGDVRSVKEVADYVIKLLPDADISLLPGIMGVSHKFETTPIKEELGFSPQWLVERGVKDMINATRRHHGLPVV